MIQTYFFYTPAQGLIDIPPADRMNELRIRGMEPVFYLDANVCLDLIRLGDGQDKLVEKPKAHHLLSGGERSGIDLLASFGVLELSTKNDGLTIDSDALKKKAGTVARAYSLDLDMSGVLQNPGPYPTRSGLLLERPSGTLSTVAPLLYGFYVCLLKIRQLDRDGAKSRDAIPNMEAFSRFLRKQIDWHLGLPLQVALAVFGGHDETRRFLALDKKSDQRARTLAAAWDLFHVQMSIMSTGMNQYPIFVTAEKALADLVSKYRVPGPFRAMPSLSFPRWIGIEDKLMVTLEADRSPRVADLNLNNVIGRVRSEIQHLEADLWEDYPALR